MLRNLFFISFIFICTTGKAQTKNFIDQPFIEVTGSSDTLVTPNEIYIRIIISEKDSRNRTSIEEQEKTMVAGLKTLGIDVEKDLTVSDLLSNYRFYIFKQKDVLKTKSYSLKVSTAFTTGKVFILLEDLDISNASIEKIDHSALDLIKSLCRAKAAVNAKDKAALVTNYLGQTLGPAINITDLEIVSDNMLTGRAAGITLRGMRSITDDFDKYVVPDVAFEKIRVRQSLNIKFILNPK